MDARETPAPERDWFARWFGEDYKRLYPHRDAAQAADQVDALLRAAGEAVPGLAPDFSNKNRDEINSDKRNGAVRALDVGCGAGRHLRALRARGLAAFGIDLSPVLLRDARTNAGPVARADMRRLPFGDGRFDLVACFFTTFGYFDSREEDLDSLLELRRVVRPSGLLFLDLPNPVVVRRDLVPSERVERDGLRADIERRIEGDRVIKRIRISRQGSGAVAGDEIHEERVRLYTREDMGIALDRSGFGILTVIGDERGAAFDSEVSPRMSLLLRREP